MSPSAATRRHAAAATLHLPFTVPAKDMFSLKECGTIMGLSDSFVEKLYDSGELSGHSHNAARGERNTKRVTRVKLIAYMVKTANYTDESILESLVSCLRALSEPQLADLRLAITHEFTRRAAA